MYKQEQTIANKSFLFRFLYMKFLFYFIIKKYTPINYNFLKNKYIYIYNIHILYYFKLPL